MLLDYGPREVVTAMNVQLPVATVVVTCNESVVIVVSGGLISRMICSAGSNDVHPVHTIYRIENSPR